MIYYSVIPPEMALLTDSHSSIREVTVDGVLMQVEMIHPMEGRIQRLLSPEPHHYLDPRFQPGQRISLPLS